MQMIKDNNIIFDSLTALTNKLQNKESIVIKLFDVMEDTFIWAKDKNDKFIFANKSICNRSICIFSKKFLSRLVGNIRNNQTAFVCFLKF